MLDLIARTGTMKIGQITYQTFQGKVPVLILHFGRNVPVRTFDESRDFVLYKQIPTCSSTWGFWRKKMSQPSSDPYGKFTLSLPSVHLPSPNAHLNTRLHPSQLSIKCGSKAWKREANRVARHRNRSRKKGASASLRTYQWVAILDALGWNCAFCPAPFETLEHIWPVANGGSTCVQNCVPCCQNCNHERNEIFNARLPVLPRHADMQQLIEVTNNEHYAS